MNGPPASVADLLHQGFRYALSLTHDRAWAEDLLQDGWVAVLKAGGPAVKAYLFPAIRTRFLNQLRRERVAPMVSLEGAVEDGALEPLARESETRAPADRIDLERALASLHPEEREALYLNVVEGATALEIAELTGRPRGTILSLIFRARKKLRRFLETHHWESRNDSRYAR